MGRTRSPCAFVEALRARVEAIKVGAALSAGTDMGPVVSQAQLEQDLSDVEIGKAEGASLLTGGGRVACHTGSGHEGYFMAPALFGDTQSAMRINREEIFGPVASVIRVKGYEEALAVANDTEFGLSAGIATTSLKYATRFKRHAQAGMVTLNLPTAGVDYHVPFGGRKGSSYSPRDVEQSKSGSSALDVTRHCRRHDRRPSQRKGAMIAIPGLTKPLAAVGKRITAWHEVDDRLFVQATSSTRWAKCPKCSRRSDQMHGRYHRQLGDQPCFGHPVTISIEIRRFKCANANCTQRTFSERVDALAPAGHRRTRRLNEALHSLGYALGGAAAARLASRLGMRTSDDTVLRELRRAGCTPPATPPIVIGIDDWAIARGHRYGTIIVDLQSRRPIGLLGGREATIVAHWLGRHPTVTVVALRGPGPIPTQRTA
jgi:hypothetical protein